MTSLRSQTRSPVAKRTIEVATTTTATTATTATSTRHTRTAMAMQKSSSSSSGSGGDASADVHESIEAKATFTNDDDDDVDADGDPDDEADADGEADPDVDMDADADADADAEGDDDIKMADSAIAVASGARGSRAAEAMTAAAAAAARPPRSNRAKRDLLHLIETTAHYLSGYQENGEEIAAGFQRIPNKRLLPDYFDVIKEPTAFSTVRGKVQKRTYTDFQEFVRDVALICHNAQVYNRPSAPIFQDAVRLRQVLQEKLQQLVKEGTIQPEEAVLPDLGEIPDSPSPLPEGDEGEADGEGDEDDEDEDDEDDDEDDEDDEDEDDDSETGRRRGRRRGLRFSAVGRRKATSGGGNSAGAGAGANRMSTPTEARVNGVLAGLRRVRDEDGELLAEPFEKLPDRTLLPEYYEEIKQPVALDMIKRKARRQQYNSVDDALADLELMFNNAKAFNQDGSAIFEAAVTLQRRARELAAQERAKPDAAFRDEQGRLALPAAQHLGQLWRIGDWAHLRNANDPGKPIVAQIVRLWMDASGHGWVRACWYYRPEQTVHRFDRHFYENEVLKTEQYRDHRLEEVVDRCFVMFVPQFARGRPRGFPLNKAVYVCAHRYLEDKGRFVRIKNWDSCMPDEVRGLDYTLDPFPMPRPLFPRRSPIKHLLREDAKETDPLPKPTWGNANAPPLIGAVHRRPRLANETPPPEPSATLPPQQFMPGQMQLDPTRRVSMPGGPPMPMPVPMPGGHPGYHLQHPGSTPSPVPMQSPSPHTPYAQQHFVPRPRAPTGPMPPGPGMAPAHIQPSPHAHPMQPMAAHPPAPMGLPPQGPHSHLAPAPGAGPNGMGGPHFVPHHLPPQQQHQQPQQSFGPPGPAPLTPVHHQNHNNNVNVNVGINNTSHTANNNMMVRPPQAQPSPQPHQHPLQAPPPQRHPSQHHLGMPGVYTSPQHLPQQQQQQLPPPQHHRMGPTPPLPTPSPGRPTAASSPHRPPPHQQPQQQQQQHQTPTMVARPSSVPPPPVPNGYVPPRATAEAYVLPEAIDRTIPAGVRKRYHRDGQGRVLFFTAPSVGHRADTVAAATDDDDDKDNDAAASPSVRVAPEYAGLGHSAAAKAEATARMHRAAGEALGEFVQWMNAGTQQLLRAEGKETGTTEGDGGSGRHVPIAASVGGQS
ncbi:rsc complex subunit [Niveomyces insectorum RCEF 264]|uniref:Rsc complex subunit n=1 Tax=Niveomyces insectorum RCEF 264 TaxID=1081102 RepID=A0A167MW23_9HYPO|nr:rsc complex subunit [Niveomyces insectorum RCEF 264]